MILQKTTFSENDFLIYYLLSEVSTQWFIEKRRTISDQHSSPGRTSGANAPCTPACAGHVSRSSQGTAPSPTDAKCPAGNPDKPCAERNRHHRDHQDLASKRKIKIQKWKNVIEA